MASSPTFLFRECGSFIIHELWGSSCARVHEIFHKGLYRSCSDHPEQYAHLAALHENHLLWTTVHYRLLLLLLLFLCPRFLSLFLKVVQKLHKEHISSSLGTPTTKRGYHLMTSVTTSDSLMRTWHTGHKKTNLCLQRLMSWGPPCTHLNYEYNIIKLTLPCM